MTTTEQGGLGLLDMSVGITEMVYATHPLDQHRHLVVFTSPIQLISPSIFLALATLGAWPTNQTSRVRVFADAPQAIPRSRTLHSCLGSGPLLARARLKKPRAL